MTVQDIIAIVSVVFDIAIIVAMFYYQAKGDVMGIVSQLIAVAEKTGKPGVEKMALVVDAMYQKLPAPFRGILSKEKLQLIAQSVFDWTRQYALEYLAAKTKQQYKEEKAEENTAESQCVDDWCFIEEEMDVVPEIVETGETDSTDQQ